MEAISKQHIEIKDRINKFEKLPTAKIVYSQQCNPLLSNIGKNKTTAIIRGKHNLTLSNIEKSSLQLKEPNCLKCDNGA